MLLSLTAMSSPNLLSKLLTTNPVGEAPTGRSKVAEGVTPKPPPVLPW